MILGHLRNEKSSLQLILLLTMYVIPDRERKRIPIQNTRAQNPNTLCASFKDPQLATGIAENDFQTVVHV